MKSLSVMMRLNLKDFFLTGPTFSSSSSGWYLLFAYHMFGTSMGTLHLQGYLQKAYTTLWSASGDQGSTWLQAAVMVPSATTQLRFLGTTGSGASSDIAIDDLQLQLGSS